MHISLQDTDFVFFIDTQEWDFWIIWDVDQRAWVLSHKMNTFARLLGSPVLTRVTRSHCDHLPTLHVIGHHPLHPKTHSLCQIFSVVKIWPVWDEPPGMLCYQSMVLGKHLLCRGKAIGTQINLTNPTANRAARQVKMEQIHLHSFEAFLTQIWNEATNAKLEKLIICK